MLAATNLRTDWKAGKAQSEVLLSEYDLSVDHWSSAGENTDRRVSEVSRSLYRVRIDDSHASTLAIDVELVKSCS